MSADTHRKLTSQEKLGLIIVSLLALIALAVVWSLPPIPQDPEYHNFIDTRMYLGIPNFWNVISNLGFLIVGIAGLTNQHAKKPGGMQYTVFFGGITLCTFGSAWYHWNPNNDTLIWDRLPMTIAFMSLTTIVISECISRKTGQLLLVPALLVGAFSLLVWKWTDDLRMYALVQFLPMLVLPVIILLFRSSYRETHGYWWLLAWYVVAKIFEYFDAPIYTGTHLISGHSLKHVAGAIGIWCLLRSYRTRQLISNGKGSV